MSDLFQQSPIAQIVICPQDDEIIAVNLAAQKLLGQDNHQIQQARASQLFHSSMNAFLLLTQEIISRGEAWSDQLTISAGSDDVRVEVSGNHYHHSERKVIHLCLQDLSTIDTLRAQSDANTHHAAGLESWNRATRVFQEFERENRLLLEAAGEGIYGLNAQGMVTFVNPAAERILGYSNAELSGRNMHSVVHHSHADGSHYRAEDCPIFAAFRDGTVHKVDDDTFWTRQGKPLAVEYTSTPVIDQDEIIGTVVIFRDITEKKADRRQLLAAMEEVERLKNRLEMENAYLQEELSSELNHQIVGKSPALQNTLRQMQMVAPTDATVLIHGESGTGKELIARGIHEESKRSHRSLIRVNCAAIPGDLFESEFFGHSRGAFTGANSDRTGRFELAHEGTLFLDEVGEIPLHLQGKLLRVLQEQQFERIGETQTRHVDVRVIAATNRDLESLVHDGLFREDLYFRLNVFPIKSIPLRERPEDIPLLAQHFLQKAGQRFNRDNLRLSLSELDKLIRYHWPGNIRELENVIERQVILCRDHLIRFDDTFGEPSRSSLLKTSEAPPKSLVTEDQLREQQRRAILSALQKSRGKVSGAGGAAELLGINPTTLASRIKKLCIRPGDFKP